MDVKVYAGNDPYSDMVKNLLKYYNTEFECISIRTEEDKQKLINISGQDKTPVIEVNGKVFCGFDREKIKELLKLS